MSLKKKILGATAPMTLFLYLAICFFAREFTDVGGDIWWKMLPIFLLNIIMPFILGVWKFRFSIPVVITIIYLIIGFVSSYLEHPLWHPAWVIYLLIPVIEIFKRPSKQDKHTRVIIEEEE